MPQLRSPSEALTERFDRLMRELDADSGDRPVMADESDYFNLVDLAAEDPDTDLDILDEAGKRFADHFVAPYLHAEDPAVLVAEIAALFEIHHRGSVTLESMDPTAKGLEIVVSFRRLSADGRHAPPTRFDLAVMQHALGLRIDQARIEMLPGDDEQTGRFRIRIKN